MGTRNAFHALMLLAGCSLALVQLAIAGDLPGGASPTPLPAPSASPEPYSLDPSGEAEVVPHVPVYLLATCPNRPKPLMFQLDPLLADLAPIRALAQGDPANLMQLQPIGSLALQSMGIAKIWKVGDTHVIEMDKKHDDDRAPVVLYGGQTGEVYSGGIRVRDIARVSGSVNLEGGTFTLTNLADINVGRLPMGDGAYLVGVYRTGYRVKYDRGAKGAIENAMGLAFDFPLEQGSVANPDTRLRAGVFVGPDILLDGRSVSIGPVLTGSVGMEF